MLGVLEVRTDDGELLEVGGSRLRTLLIMLALRPGQVVPASELIDGLWAEQAPNGAADALQALISRLVRQGQRPQRPGVRRPRPRRIPPPAPAAHR
jgi:DNA-binding SARP family transcriptional activator